MFLYVVERSPEDYEDCGYQDSIWTDPTDALYRLAELAYENGRKTYDYYWNIQVMIANRAPTAQEPNFAFIAYPHDYDFSNAPAIEIEQMNIFNAIAYNLRDVNERKERIEVKLYEIPAS